MPNLPWAETCINSVSWRGVHWSVKTTKFKLENSKYTATLALSFLNRKPLPSFVYYATRKRDLSAPLPFPELVGVLESRLQNPESKVPGCKRATT